MSTEYEKILEKHIETLTALLSKNPINDEYVYFIVPKEGTIVYTDHTSFKMFYSSVVDALNAFTTTGAGSKLNSESALRKIDDYKERFTIYAYSVKTSESEKVFG